MNIRIFFGLGAVFLANGFSVFAIDNPAQAAARTAMEQKLKELGDFQAQPAPVPPRWDTAQKPAAIITTRTNTASTATVPQQIATAPAMPVVAVAPSVSQVPETKITLTLPPVTSNPARPAAAPKPSVPRTPQKPAGNIVTIYGTVYRNAEVLKVESDGVLISYWTENGGFGITKVEFKVLPVELRDQYQNRRAEALKVESFISNSEDPIGE